MRHGSLLALLMVLFATPGFGQATVVGRAYDDSTGAGIAGVEVVLVGTSLKTTTDELGSFTLGGVPPRIGYVLFRKLGYRPLRIRALIFGDDTLDLAVPMPRGAVELEPIEVTAAAVPPGLDAFAERRAMGFGAYIDWHQLRAEEHRRLGDLFRSVRGVKISENSSSFRTVALGRRQCVMAMWVDNVPYYQPGRGQPIPDLNNFPVAQLEAVEIYRGPAETPASLNTSGSDCGTIVLWTRRR